MQSEGAASDSRCSTHGKGICIRAGEQSWLLVISAEWHTRSHTADLLFIGAEPVDSAASIAMDATATFKRRIMQFYLCSKRCAPGNCILAGCLFCLSMTRDETIPCPARETCNVCGRPSAPLRGLDRTSSCTPLRRALQIWKKSPCIHHPLCTCKGNQVLDSF